MKIIDFFIFIFFYSKLCKYRYIGNDVKYEDENHRFKVVEAWMSRVERMNRETK